MDTSDLRFRIVSFIANRNASTSTGDIPRDANLFSEGLLDSIGIMQLIGEIESWVGRKVPPEDLVPANFLTINAMTIYAALLEARP